MARSASPAKTPSIDSPFAVEKHNAASAYEEERKLETTALHSMIRRTISPLADTVEKLGAGSQSIRYDGGSAMSRIQEVKTSMERHHQIIENVASKQGETIISHQSDSAEKHGQVSQKVGYMGGRDGHPKASAGNMPSIDSTGVSRG